MRKIFELGQSMLQEIFYFQGFNLQISEIYAFMDILYGTDKMIWKKCPTTKLLVISMDILTISCYIVSNK